MERKILFMLLITLASYANSSQDLYSSIDGLELLVDSERKFLDILEDYIDAEMERLESLQLIANRRNAMMKLPVEKIANNPMEEFKFINTFFGTEKKLKNSQEKPGTALPSANSAALIAPPSSVARQNRVLLSLGKSVDNCNRYATDGKKIFHPKDDDMVGAAVALLRLQDTYNIEAEELHEGMSADDCFYMGHVSLLKGKYESAIPWLMIAEQKMTMENGTDVDTRQFNKTVLFDYLAYAFREQENFEWASYYMMLVKVSSPEYPADIHLQYYEKMMQERNSTWDGSFENLPVIKIKRTDNDFPEYEALCRGENQNTTWLHTDQIYCYYKRNSPYLKLAPIKVELLHRKPDVFLFPEAMWNSETDALLELASPEVLNRALVVNPDWKNSTEDNYEIKSQYRTSKLFAIDDSMFELSEIISKRVSQMSDLSLAPESTEQLQIANYGIGGHYAPHYDMATSEEDMDRRKHMFGSMGNRIATLLFYLSDPKGGATVFDDIGVTVFPRKNSAIMWYNLHANAESHNAKIANVFDDAFMPESDDVKGAALALLRLQDTYALSVEELAQNMTNEEVWLISYESVNDSNFWQAVPWLQFLEQRILNDMRKYGRHPVLMSYQSRIYELLAWSLREQRNFEWAMWYTKKLKTIRPDFDEKPWMNYYREALKVVNSSWDFTQSNLPKIKLDKPLLKDLYPEFNPLCRGEVGYTTIQERKKLSCYLKKNTEFLKLAPIKVEQLNHEPDVFRFVDVISNGEISTLMEIAAPQLRRAKVINERWKFNASKPRDIVSKDRTAKHTGIQDESHEVVARLTRRVSDMTDLDMETAEELQIANYGLGGHYSPHYDMATDYGEINNRTPGNRKSFGPHGNRIGTVLFYLSEPIAGGATVFDEIELAAFPTKNDAIFWHNLYKNGNPDFMTHHGGCPVLEGSKWIANKWLHERGNEFKRPCSLDPNE